MNAWRKLMTSCCNSTIPMILHFLFCPAGLRAQALVVDCTGANPNAYRSINAALPNATPGAFILVTGPCTENVFLNGQTGLNLGAYYGHTATINGSISINNSQNLFLYGLNVTNLAGDGISISNRRGISLNVCASNGNAGVGLRVGGMSDVTIGASGAFDHNAFGGININSNSLVALVAWAGPVDISNNSGPGVWESGSSVFTTLGPTNITNNVSGPGTNPGFGLELLGGARASAGVDLYANSQAYFHGTNQVLRNGTVTDPHSAGIRVDGNSEAFLRGGQVAQNYGPGILALVNSSADFTGVNFAGNAQGEIIDCDSSSWMVSDLAQPNRVPPAGVLCKTPHALGNRDISKALPPTPDWSAHKARHDRYAKFAIRQ